MGDVEDRYAHIMKDMKSLGEELAELRAENEDLKEQVRKLRQGTATATQTGMSFANLGMEDVNHKAKCTNFMTGLEEECGTGSINEEDDEDFSDDSSDTDSSDGMALSASVAADPRKSSYATGYDYSLLTAKEILIAMHDVGTANRYIDDGPGMWVNYILTLERSNTLKVVNKAQLLKYGKYYHIKSIRKNLPVEDLLRYCKKKGIRAIVPASVSDEIYMATHIKELQANGVYPFVCDDPQNYLTLDHKWLSYEFCIEQGIPQDETLPLRVDTVDACRALAEKCIADGKPCFFKECFDTLAGLGVIKVDKMEDYDSAVLRITSGKGPEPADTKGVDQHIILQAGHPGRISCCHNIFYKGKHVSCYVTKENSAIMDQLGAYKLDMTIGDWSPRTDDLSTSFKLDLDDPSDRNIRDQAVQIMGKVGKALNWTGMLEVEFIVEETPDAVVHVLEFNPRFSGACHSYVGAGMVQDYMNVVGMIATTEDDTDKVMAAVAGDTRVRSDTHVPKSNFRDYNAAKFYVKQPRTILKLRTLS